MNDRAWVDMMLPEDDDCQSSSGERRTRRIVLLGAECTGKTTLAASAADQFGLAVAPEAARVLVSRLGRGLLASDVDRVARLHLELASDCAGGPAAWALLDTDLLATAVYSAHYFGRCPAWILRRALVELADLYVLCSTNGVPFQAENGQRGTAADREEVQCRFEHILRRIPRPVLRVSGGLPERIDTLARAIAVLTQGSIEHR